MTDRIEQVKEILEANESVKSDDEGTYDKEPDRWMHFVDADDYDKVAQKICALYEPEPQADEDGLITDEALISVVDEADCNAEVCFIDSKRYQRLLGWALRLLKTATKAQQALTAAAWMKKMQKQALDYDTLRKLDKEAITRETAAAKDEEWELKHNQQRLAFGRALFEGDAIRLRQRAECQALKKETLGGE